MSTSSPETGYHHGDLKRALLEAALEMLDQEGADGVGLRELARKVGVSPAAPYRHFRSRQALLEAVATEGFRRFSAMMAAKEADLPEAEQVPAIGSALGPVYAELPDGRFLQLKQVQGGQDYENRDPVRQAP